MKYALRCRPPFFVSVWRALAREAAAPAGTYVRRRGQIACERARVRRCWDVNILIGF